ncbi:MAG: sigma 54-interacting transcriptional regulator [Anaerovoracaceae bacterium]
MTQELSIDILGKGNIDFCEGEGKNITQLTENKKLDELEKTKFLMTELQEIIEGSFDGILVTDKEANVLLVNQSYVRNTDIQKEELLGHNIRELINPIWMKNSVALLAIEQGRPVSMHHTTRHGKRIIVTGTPLFEENGEIKMVVVNTRDISEIYALKEEVIDARKMEKVYHEQMNLKKVKTGTYGDIIVMNDKMQEVYSLAKKISDFNTTVLITGESGVGKDVLARYIHENSTLRKGKPYIAINCGSIPESLLASELFGYEEGAFTGASKGGKIGLMEAANGGTLMLDEIGEMSLQLQVKVLRALETRTINRVGSTESVPVDIRVVAATNKNLKEMVEKEEFREDLFYRLNVITIDIPPLRERKDEIVPLALGFLNQFNTQYGQCKRLTYAVLEELKKNDWEGNIRQLKNVIENMVVVSNNEYLQVTDLPWIEKIRCIDLSEDAERSFKEIVEDYEKFILEKAKAAYGSSRKIASALKIDQSTVIRKLNKYNIE